MYWFNEIKALHIEISSLCQAACPMCARNRQGRRQNPLIREQNIDLEFYKKVIEPTFIKQLETIVFCGNFGDPILNLQLIDIIEYTVSHNPDIKIELHTNGSARTEAWWKNLAHALPVNHMVHFGIDGLEDTHHLYRIDTNFNLILKNAQAFISQGGIARWNFITFKHNEHQINDAMNLAKKLGFDSFYEKQTARFIGEHSFNVYNKDNSIAYELQDPTERKIVFLEKQVVKDFRIHVANAKVTCQVEESKNVYIDALGHLWPCCWTAAIPYLYADEDELLYEYTVESKKSLDKVLSHFKNGNDLHNNAIKELVNSDAWQTKWNSAFDGPNKLHVCARVCGKWKESIVSQCRDEFLDLKKLDV